MLDLDELAREWDKKQAPPPAAPTPRPSPPPFREAPDGTLIGSGWFLDWHGDQGDPAARVVLRSQESVVFDGPFAELHRQVIPGVWVPPWARAGAAPPVELAPVLEPENTALEGLGEAERRSRRRKYMGIGLAALAVGTIAVTVAVDRRRRQEA